MSEFIEKAWEGMREKFIDPIELQPYSVFDRESFADPRRRRGTQLVWISEEIATHLLSVGALVHELSPGELSIRVFKGGCRMCGSFWCDRGEWHNEDCPIGYFIQHFLSLCEDRSDKYSVYNRLDDIDALLFRLKNMKEYPEFEIARNSVERVAEARRRSEEKQDG